MTKINAAPPIVLASTVAEDLRTKVYQARRFVAGETGAILDRLTAALAKAEVIAARGDEAIITFIVYPVKK